MSATDGSVRAGFGRPSVPVAFSRSGAVFAVASAAGGREEDGLHGRKQDSPVGTFAVFQSSPFGIVDLVEVGAPVAQVSFIGDSNVVAIVGVEDGSEAVAAIGRLSAEASGASESNVLGGVLAEPHEATPGDGDGDGDHSDDDSHDGDGAFVDAIDYHHSEEEAEDDLAGGHGGRTNATPPSSPGGGRRLPHPVHNHSVVLFDVATGRVLRSVTFTAKVTNVVVTETHLAVRTWATAFFFELSPQLRLVRRLNAGEDFPVGVALANGAAVGAVPTSGGPDVHGSVDVVWLDDAVSVAPIEAHRNSLVAMALTHGGHFLATVSTQGTRVRVFNTTSGTAVYDLRRGTFGATNHSLAFDIPAERLVLTSAETVHVFDLSQTASAADADGSRRSKEESMLASWLPGALTATTSFARFRLPSDAASVAAFDQLVETSAEPDRRLCSVFVATATGAFYRFEYDPSLGGDIERYSFGTFGGGDQR